MVDVNELDVMVAKLELYRYDSGMNADGSFGLVPVCIARHDLGHDPDYPNSVRVGSDPLATINPFTADSSATIDSRIPKEMLTVSADAGRIQICSGSNSCPAYPAKLGEYQQVENRAQLCAPSESAGRTMIDARINMQLVEEPQSYWFGPKAQSTTPDGKAINIPLYRLDVVPNTKVLSRLRTEAGAVRARSYAAQADRLERPRSILEYLKQSIWHRYKEPHIAADHDPIPGTWTRFVRWYSKRNTHLERVAAQQNQLSDEPLAQLKLYEITTAQDQKFFACQIDSLPLTEAAGVRVQYSKDRPARLLNHEPGKHHNSAILFSVDADTVRGALAYAGGFGKQDMKQTDQPPTLPGRITHEHQELSFAKTYADWIESGMSNIRTLTANQAFWFGPVVPDSTNRDGSFIQQYRLDILINKEKLAAAKKRAETRQ